MKPRSPFAYTIRRFREGRLAQEMEFADFDFARETADDFCAPGDRVDVVDRSGVVVHLVGAMPAETPWKIADTFAEMSEALAPDLVGAL